MPTYLITLRHDHGIINIHTAANSAAGAKSIIMATENCPARSILAVRSYDSEKFELDVDTGRRRVVAVVSDKRESFSRNGQNRPDKVPTRWQVQLPGDTRWRRVYGTRHTGLQYIVVDNLRVVVQLPEAI